MTNKKISKIITVALAALVLLSGCKEKDPEPDPIIATADYEIDVTMIDQWREDNGEAREYFLSAIVYSPDTCAALDEDSVQYLTDEGEYVPVGQVYDGSTTVVNMLPDTTSETSFWILVKTDTILDSGRLFIDINGPAVADPDATTMESYEEKYGVGTWRNTLMPVTNNGYTAEELTGRQDSPDGGMIFDQSASFSPFWIHADGELTWTENPGKWSVNIPITALSDMGFEETESLGQMISWMYEDEERQLPEGTKFNFDFQDEMMTLTFETDDANNLPDTAVFNVGTSKVSVYLPEASLTANQTT